MNFQIKNRFTGVVQFECELSADVTGQEYRFQLGFAVRKAVEARADLAGADLAGAYLAGADLAGANLAGADLAGADLAGADLAGADLAGANLAGAKVRDNLTLVGKRPFFQLGPIGSRNDVLRAYTTEAGLRIQAGCFWGTAEEFREQLADTHANNEHAQEYDAALLLIEKHAELWAPTEIKEKAA